MIKKNMLAGWLNITIIRAIREGREPMRGIMPRMGKMPRLAETEDSCLFSAVLIGL